MPRRAFLLAAGVAGAVATVPALAQVDVGDASRLRSLVPAEEIEAASVQEYSKLLAQARQQGALAPDGHPQLQRLRGIANRLIPHSAQWNSRARQWRWEVNLIGSKQINAFCMPGGKIAFFTGILDQLKLTDDEAAMVMGHEMAHALREHGREAMSKAYGIEMAKQGAGALFGLGSDTLALADTVANYGMTLPNSRANENEADLIGLELAARAGYNPNAAITLWNKMAKASEGSPPEFMSTHPASSSRIASLQAAIPKVMPLYEQAKKS